MSLSPKTISVPQPVSNDVQRTLQLVTAPGEKTRIMDVEASNPAIKAVLAAGPDDQTQRIQVTIPREAVLDEKGETIKVFTDDADYTTLICDVRPYRFSRASSVKPASSRPAASQPAPERAPARVPAKRLGGIPTGIAACEGPLMRWVLYIVQVLAV